MLRILLAAVMFLHGLIHFMGFAKAFKYADIKQLSIPISKPIGLLWAIIAFLFIITVIFFLLEKQYWWMMAIIAAVISQVLIVMSWKDAKFGTIANIIILVAAVLQSGSYFFENSWKKAVTENIKRTGSVQSPILKEQDIQHLPVAVQRYLHYTGLMGKPKVINMKVEMEVRMREKGKDFFSARAVQYNFFDEPTRLFFMKAKMFGSTVPGYHHYINGNAVMDIRLFGWIPIVKKEGQLMNKTETVTLFNDMCLMAPATLIDQRIQWQVIDANTVKAIFTNHNISITAILYFNELGQLVNFYSEDRMEVKMMKHLPFTTPVHSYKKINGFNLFQEGDAVWEYPDGKFVYGKFRLKDVQYNLSEATSF